MLDAAQNCEDAAKETQLGQNTDAYVYLFHFPQLGSPTELLLCATPVPSASAGGPPLVRLWALELRPDEQLLTTGTGASIYVYIRTRVYQVIICVRMRPHVYMCTRVYTRTCMNVYTRVYTCTYVRIHVRTSRM